MRRFQGTNRKDPLIPKNLRGPRNVLYEVIYFFFHLRILNLQRLTCFKIRYDENLMCLVFRMQLLDSIL